MGPCDWPISYSSCSSCEALTSLEEKDKAAFEQAAVDYLWNWTNQAFGLCETSIRPCRSVCSTGRESTFWGLGPFSGGSAPWEPVLIGGSWYNLRCGGCGLQDCECSSAHSLYIPGPVNSISRILIDGEVLSPSAYRVDNHTLLVRTDGGYWPSGQDLDLPPTQPGTFVIEYKMGIEVPIGGQQAAGRLACEFAKAACGDKTCGLPQRVQSIVRQGVTMTMLDSFDDIDKGHTGIWPIDAWVASVTKPQPRSFVRSVDLPRIRQRRQTWPTP